MTTGVDPSLVAELDDLRAAAGLPPQELTEAELSEEARAQIEEGRAVLRASESGHPGANA